MDEKKEIYFNFPLHLLQGVFDDTRQTMSDIMDYAAVSYVIDKCKGGVKGLKIAEKDLGFTLGSYKNTWDNGKSLRIHNKQPFIGINKKTCFDFYENEKKEKDIAVLAMYLGIKSILGNSGTVKTNRAHCVARMLGYLTYKEAQHLELYTKYTTRRRFEGIMQTLELKFGLKKIAHQNRGFYISTNLTYDQMAQIILTDKQRYAELQQLKKAAIQKAQDKLMHTLNGKTQESTANVHLKQSKT